MVGYYLIKLSSKKDTMSFHTTAWVGGGHRGDPCQTPDSGGGYRRECSERGLFGMGGEGVGG